MNKRIQELEKQATETVECGLNGTHTAIRFNRKKFAELIVKECIEIMRLVPYSSDREFGDEVIYQDAIKKHFGVEE